MSQSNLGVQNSKKHFQFDKVVGARDWPSWNFGIADGVFIKPKYSWH